MAKAIKKIKTKRAGKYDTKLAVNGTFLDIMKASAKRANSKSTIKK
jgi:hypothetical protein